MIALGLDVGTKTIGVAVASDPGIFPVCTLARQSVTKDCVRLDSLLRERKADLVVVGLPLALDGSEQRTTRLARQIGEALSALGWLVVYEDERYSTVEALERLSEAKVFGVRRQQSVDQVAAVVILESWQRRA